MDTTSKEKNSPGRDALHKVLAQAYEGKSFALLGIKLPPIRELLPAIPLRDGFIDSLFLLEDGTYAVVEYASGCHKTDMAQYPNYIAKVMEKYDKGDGYFDLHLIIIYTGDVEKADPVFDCGCLTLRPKQVFLSRIDGEAEFDAIRQKIHSGIVLTDDDLMKLVILPLTVPGTEGKQRMLERIVDLAEQIPDEGQRIFTLSGVIVASDKFINRDYMEQIRRRINMTQLGQLYEKEKIEYANQKVREKAIEIAKALLEDYTEMVKIMKVTGLTEAELLRLQNEKVTV